MTFFGNSAVISHCEKYRYVLKREVIKNPLEIKRCVFIMLNPSTADALEDDPTVRRCISFAKSWGYSHLSIINLYALRATNPKALKEQKIDYIEGPSNYSYQGLETVYGDLIVAAWGTHGGPKGTARIQKLLKDIRVMCLGKNKDGSPKHPLYVKGDKELEDFKI